MLLFSCALLFYDPMDCSPSGSSVHGIFQARILEWLAISFPRGSSWPRVKLASCALQVDSLLMSHQGNLEKCVEVPRIPWPKLLLPILLNLRSTLFGTHKLSPFEIITGCPMHLVPASFDPQVTKREILQYCKSLIASIKSNFAFIE